jgi:hypothetical protein
MTIELFLLVTGILIFLSIVIWIGIEVASAIDYDSQASGAIQTNKGDISKKDAAINPESGIESASENYSAENESLNQA